MSCLAAKQLNAVDLHRKLTRLAAPIYSPHPSP